MSVWFEIGGIIVCMFMKVIFTTTIESDAVV